MFVERMTIRLFPSVNSAQASASLSPCSEKAKVLSFASEFSTPTSNMVYSLCSPNPIPAYRALRASNSLGVIVLAVMSPSGAGAESAFVVGVRFVAVWWW